MFRIPILTLIILPITTIITVYLFYGILGYDAGQVINTIKITDDSNNVIIDTVTLNNGEKIGIECQSLENNKSEKTFFCNLYHYGQDTDMNDYILKLQFTEIIKGNTIQYSLTSRMLPRVADGLNNLGPLEEKAILSKAEQQNNGQTQLIANIKPIFLGMGIHVYFNLGMDSLKGFILSELRKSAHILKLTIDKRELDRIGDTVSYAIDNNLKLFQLRKNKSMLIFAGTIEFIIVIFAVYSLLLSFSIVILHIYPNIISHQTNTIQLLGLKAGQLGEILTYFGLFGTLLGIFGTVSDLSSVNFIDELRKVFDQTSAFGAMSLAISTSILGVGASILVWLVQTVISMAIGRDYFFK